MFSSIIAVYRDIASYFWPLSNRNNLIRFSVLAVLFLFAVFYSISNSKSTEAPAPITQSPVVKVGTVDDINESTASSYIGKVRAVSEAQIQTEVGGRVTSVRVKAGDYVTAGSVIATLENSAQQASVLQAQGSYEAALAVAAQSEVSVSGAESTLISAKNSVASAYRNAYTSVNNIVINTLDQFYSSPEGQTPGVKIDSKGNTTYFNSARVNLQSVLQDWKIKSNNIADSNTLDSELSTAINNTMDVIVLTDTFIEVANKAKTQEVLNGKTVSSYTVELSAVRATLNGVISSLQTAESALASAKEGLLKAKIASDQNTQVSVANAQVKQALGSLRSAQANLEKTIMRSPIAGTVNSVEVNTGDFITGFTQVAEVANNSALEISIYLGSNDIDKVTIGDTVEINNNLAGTITNIAPAIDQNTLKTEVKVATESTELKNGDTATVKLSSNVVSRSENANILVPITAVKFTADAGSVFTVVDEKLVAIPVTIGPVVGSFVTIKAGVTTDTVFVFDARGLSEGAKVEPIK